MRNRNFAVGLFVATALLAFVGGTIWLTGKQGSEPTVSYSMYFEKDVGGLMLGGPVFYLGVEVGTVTAMEIIPGDPMRVRVDAQEPVVWIFGNFLCSSCNTSGLLSQTWMDDNSICLFARA